MSKMQRRRQIVENNWFSIERESTAGGTADGLEEYIIHRFAAVITANESVRNSVQGCAAVATGTPRTLSSTVVREIQETPRRVDCVCRIQILIERVAR
jgi:hypothetical protein